jgi:DNA polymerase elongation subunit (family B)
LEKEDKSNIEIKIKELETEISVLDQKQYALKILLNAGYGAFANEWFSMYDIRLAKSITYTSQLVIKWMKQYVKEKLNLSAIYSDTDSCEGNTIINSKKYGKIYISDYYDKITGIEEYRKKENIIKYIIDADKILSFNIDKKIIEYQKSNYIMKHKVKKKLYKIKTGQNEIIITEDHSIIVNRNNEYVSIKPKDVLKMDKIIEII